MDSETEPTKVACKLEYKSAKNDDPKRANEATSQIKNVVNDINRVVENLSKVTKSATNEATSSETSGNEKAKQPRNDEIPLIDDGVEETIEQNGPQQTAPKCDATHRDQSTLGNIDHQHLSTDHHKPNSQTNTSQPASGQPAASNQSSQSFTPSYAQFNTQLANNSVPSVGGHRMMFENIKLNEDESIESVASGQTVDVNDLCQLDSVDLNPDEQEEKERLIQQLLELRNTLDDLSNRVSSVREMSFKLTNENNVLNQYVENLMSASSVFQSTATTNSANVRRRQQRK